MTSKVKRFLELFNDLDPDERDAVTQEIMRSEVRYPLTDDSLALIAEDLFTELDARETPDE